MAGNGELLRSMRAGGGGALVAARELMRRAQAGAVSGAELAEAKQVMTSPELKDAFKGMATELSALLTGGRGDAVHDVGQLQPDTERFTDARSMPERFLGDLRIVEGKLLHQPGLTRKDKAERLFSFFEAYARRFVDLAHGHAAARAAQAAQAATAEAPAQQGPFDTAPSVKELAPPLAPPELERALGQFERALLSAGFKELVTGDGRSALEVARKMLEARSSDALAQARPEALDAPGWKDNAKREKPLEAEVERERRGVYEFDAKPPVQPRLQPQALERAAAAEKKEEAARRRRDGTDKVLGGRMVWNVLHLLRGDELDDVARKDALAQLAVSAGLVLLLGAILVGVLVWL